MTERNAAQSALSQIAPPNMKILELYLKRPSRNKEAFTQMDNYKL